MRTKILIAFVLGLSFAHFMPKESVKEEKIEKNFAEKLLEIKPPPEIPKTPIPPKPPKPDLILDKNLAPVKVSCRGSWASGTAISGAPKGKTYVVTNKHVVDLEGGRTIVSDEKEYVGTVLNRSPYFDIAIISVDDVIPCVHLAASDPAPGTQITFRGCGFKTGFSILRSGVIQNCYRGAVFCSASASGGDSGAGYLNEKGELVGVLWGGTTPGTSIGVSVSEVKNLLRTLK